MPLDPFPPSTGAQDHDSCLPSPRVEAADDPGPREGRPLRVLVVDDHEIVRQGLVALLDRRPQFQVVAQAGTVAQALAEAHRFEPELVLMDVNLPDGSGIDACRAIRAGLPGTRVVILTSSPEDEDVLGAIVAGASGYVLKQSRASELVRALLVAGRGESLLDPGVTGAVIEHIRRISTGGYSDATQLLTPQERRILPLLAAGETNKEIAAQVFLSDKTVKNYVSSILAKLDLEHRSQTPAFVARHRRELGPLGSGPAEVPPPMTARNDAPRPVAG